MRNVPKMDSPNARITRTTLVMLTALGLAAWRWDVLRSRDELDAALSRESAFVINNVLFLAVAFVVFLGTVPGRLRSTRRPGDQRWAAVLRPRRTGNRA